MEFLNVAVQESAINNASRNSASWVFRTFLLRQGLKSPVSQYEQCSGPWFPVGSQSTFPTRNCVYPLMIFPPVLLAAGWSHPLPSFDLVTLAMCKTYPEPQIHQNLTSSFLYHSRLNSWNFTPPHPTSNRHPLPSWAKRSTPCDLPQSGRAFFFTTCPECLIPSLH